MQTVSKRRVAPIVFIVPGLCFLIYVFLRAYYTSFTHDESYTFYHYIRHYFYNTILGKGTDPNHHTLNSIFGQISYYLLGQKPWMLRLPNVLFFVIYLYFSFKISRRLPNLILAISGFLILLANPYLLDFFSLLRGYAGGLTCVLASMYFAIKFIENDVFRRKYLWALCLAAAISTLFHISFINFLLPLLSSLFLYLSWYFYRDENNKNIKRFLLLILPLIASFCITLFAVLPKAFTFHNAGELTFAGSSGFWADTVQSLIRYSLYSRYGPYMPMLRNAFLALIAVVLFLSCIIVFLSVKKNKKNFKVDAHTFVFAVNVIAGLGIWLQYILMKVNYPVDRLACFFLPVFALLLIFTFVKFNEFWRGAKYFLLLFALLFLANTINALNLKVTENWRYDAATPAMLDDLQNHISTTNHKKPAILAGNWMFEPVINYYRLTAGKDFLYNANRAGIWPGADYFYIFYGEKADIEGYNTQLLKDYPLSGTLLYKNLSKADTVFRHEWDKAKTVKYEPEKKFIDVFTSTKKDLNPGGKEITLAVYLKVKLEDVRAKAEILGHGFSGETMKLWKGILLQTAIPNKDTFYDVQFVLPLNDLEAEDKLTLLMHNFGKTPIHVKEMRIYGITKKE